MSKAMKIRPVGAELFRATGQPAGRHADRHGKANGHFSQFCECAKKKIKSTTSCCIQTYIHVPGGLRILSPSGRAAEHNKRSEL